jgi:hypothetical protein
MVVTGTLLFYAAPVARYENIFFRLKMAALADGRRECLGVPPNGRIAGR